MKVTEFLAIYGASLSTVIFVWNVNRARPRIKVEIVYGSREVEDEEMSGIYVSVKNPSPHIVHLSGISLLYPYKKNKLIELIAYIFKYRRIPVTAGWVPVNLSNYVLIDDFPLALEPGRSHNVFVPDETLEEILEGCSRRQIKAVVQDQLWRNKYSQKFDYA